MRDILVKGLAQLGLSDHALPQLEAYASLLLEKNKVMNLTAITEERDVATLHLLDCAAEASSPRTDSPAVRISLISAALSAGRGSRPAAPRWWAWAPPLRRGPPPLSS